MWGRRRQTAALSAQAARPDWECKESGSGGGRRTCGRASAVFKWFSASLCSAGALCLDPAWWVTLGHIRAASYPWYIFGTPHLVCCVREEHRRLYQRGRLRFAGHAQGVIAATTFEGGGAVGSAIVGAR